MRACVCRVQCLRTLVQCASVRAALAFRCHANSKQSDVKLHALQYISQSTQLLCLSVCLSVSLLRVRHPCIHQSSATITNSSIMSQLFASSLAQFIVTAFTVANCRILMPRKSNLAFANPLSSEKMGSLYSLVDSGAFKIILH